MSPPCADMVIAVFCHILCKNGGFGVVENSHGIGRLCVKEASAGLKSGKNVAFQVF